MRLVPRLPVAPVITTRTVECYPPSMRNTSGDRVVGMNVKAVTWHGKRDVRVDTVTDPTIQAPTDAIIRVTSSGICGSDLHRYELMGAFLDEGDILGHEPMGVV